MDLVLAMTVFQESAHENWVEVRCAAGGGGEGGGGLTAQVNLSFLVVQDLCA